MSKHIKALFYGAPGIGKSVFAGSFPNAFFITTDGNYEYLEGMIPNYDEDNFVQVYTWDQAKTAFGRNFDGYDTIVVDLLEDMYKFCEHDFLVQNKIISLSDWGYGKAYDCVRNDFIIELSRLIAMEKNIVLLCHEQSLVKKNKRGIEYTYNAPSNRLPDKVLDQIEGRLKFALRIFGIPQDCDGKTIINRYLSLSPDGTNEFGVLRGLDTSNLPEYIELDYDTFVTVLETNKPCKYGNVQKPEKSAAKQIATVRATTTAVKAEPVKVIEPVKTEAAATVETAPKADAKSDLLAKLKNKKADVSPLAAIAEEIAPDTSAEDEINQASAVADALRASLVMDTVEEAPVEEKKSTRGRKPKTEEVVVEEPVVEETAAPVAMDPNDKKAKLAALKASLAARK